MKFKFTIYSENYWKNWSLEAVIETGQGIFKSQILKSNTELRYSVPILAVQVLVCWIYEIYSKQKLSQ